MASDDNQVENFRQVTAATMRAISECDEIQLTFGSEARLVGTNARLPAPPREMKEEDVAHLRGEADALAFRMKYHDADIHKRFAPAATDARAVFEAMEQVRVEALGSKEFKGCKQNLSAAFKERCEAASYHRVSDQEDVSLAEVVSLLSREQLMGEELSGSAQNALGYWRNWLESRIGSDFSDLENTIHDQEAFAKTIDKVLVHLDLLDLEDDSEGDEQISEETPEDQESDDSDDESEASESSETSDGDEEMDDQDQEEGTDQSEDDSMSGEEDEDLPESDRRRQQQEGEGSKVSYKAFSS